MSRLSNTRERNSRSCCAPRWNGLIRISVACGFSLLEVVAAVAIFAIGMVAVLGLFAPVAKSISTVSDSEAAARVADGVKARLRNLPFDLALSLIQEVDDVRRN